MGERGVGWERNEGKKEVSSNIFAIKIFVKLFGYEYFNIYINSLLSNIFIKFHASKMLPVCSK